MEADKMSRVYIRFQSKDDEVKGYYALATQTRVDSLPGEIFSISDADLYILEDEQAKYTLVPHEDVSAAYQKLRTFWNGTSENGIKSKIRRWVNGRG
jgi:hypothetical protein